MTDSDHDLIRTGKIILVIVVVLVTARYFDRHWIRNHPSLATSASIGSLRTINSSEVTYRSDYPEVGFACSLEVLGPPPVSKRPSVEHAGLIDATLASGVKTGYRFAPIQRCKTEMQSGHKVVSTYTWGASPVIYGVTGDMYYCTDQSGVIKSHPHSVEECLASGNIL